MSERRNFIASVFGKKGSGKSVLLARYLPMFPRVITFDNLGERAEEFTGAIVTYSATETLEVMEDVASRERWHIIASLMPDEATEVAAALAPLKFSATNQGYARAVGGVCIECGEIDTFAPVGRTSPELRNLWQRGRHYQVSILGASQRPHLVDRIVSSQSDVLIAFAQHEPRDVKYLSDVMSQPLAHVVRRLQPFHHLRYFAGYGYAELIDPADKVLARITTDGTTERVA